MHPLKDYLTNTGASVSGFARLVGVSRQTLHRILSGAQAPKPRLARKIIDATGGAISFEALYPADDGGVIDMVAARGQAADTTHRAGGNEALDEEVLAGALRFTLETLIPRRDAHAKPVFSKSFIDAAVGAAMNTYAALAHITSRQGPDRLAQALRPILEEILKDCAASARQAGQPPLPDRAPGLGWIGHGRIGGGRIDHAADHAARFYFRALRLKRAVHAQ